MILIDAFLGVLCAMGVFGLVFQVSLVANWLILKQDDYKKGGQDLRIEPDGIEEELLRRDGSKMRVLHKGSGPVILLLPELGKKSLSMNRLWRHFSSYGYRVITFDWTGYGAQTGEKISPSRMKEDLNKVFEALKLSHVMLVGHGRSARLMMEWISELPSHSSLVRGWVSMGAPYPSKKATASPWHQRLLSFPIHSYLYKRFTGWGYAAHAFGDAPNADLLRTFPHILQLPLPDNYQETYHQLGSNALPPEIGYRGLILHAKSDQHTPYSHGLQLKRHFPRADFVLMEKGGGHMMVWEQAKAIVEYVREFDRNSQEKGPSQKGRGL